MFVSAAPQIAPAENHFGQLDVNDLLSKLISNGIIKAAQPEATQTSGIGQYALNLPDYWSKCLFDHLNVLWMSSFRFLMNHLSILSPPFSASGAAPAGSPLAEEEEEEDPDLLDNDLPDLRGFTIEAMKQ